MNIYFKQLHLYNFLSFGDTELSLNQNGYSIVRGVNNVVEDMAASNGSGKSSIWEAISWVLTGETIRGTKNVVNINADGGTYVELTFAIDGNEYKVLRSKEHKEYKTNLKIYINGEDKSGKGIRDTEKLLHEYLPDLTPSLIGSVIILGQGLPQRFSNNTPSGRKEVLEKLSKSDFMIGDLKDRISEYKKKLSDDLRNVEDELLKLSTEENLLKQRIQSNHNKLNEYSSTEMDNNKNRCAELQLLIENNKKLLENLSIEINDIAPIVESNRTKLQEVHQKYSEDTASLNSSKEYQLTNSLSLKISESNIKLKSLNAELIKLQSIKDFCPTCGQKLIGVEKPDTSAIENEINEVKSEIRILTGKKSEADIIFQNLLSQLKSEYTSTVQSLNNLISVDNQKMVEKSNKANEINSLTNTYSTELNALQERINSANAIIQSLNDDIVNCENKIIDIQEKLLYNNNVKNGIEDKLTIVGKMNSIITRDFRGVLLSNAIDFINRKAKEYSQDVFDTDKIEFKLDGNNISISYDGKEYENLSGGEKQKIDLIVQFAIRDMLCSHLGFSSNILVLDELFDNLDDIGCQKVLNLIATKLTDVESIFIVTHHTSIAIPYDNEIIVEKGKNKISKVK